MLRELAVGMLVFVIMVAVLVALPFVGLWDLMTGEDAL